MISHIAGRYSPVPVFAGLEQLCQPSPLSYKCWVPAGDIHREPLSGLSLPAEVILKAIRTSHNLGHELRASGLPPSCSNLLYTELFRQQICPANILNHGQPLESMHSSGPVSDHSYRPTLVAYQDIRSILGRGRESLHQPEIAVKEREQVDAVTGDAVLKML